MARQFATPIALPADPSSALHASTKGYVDVGLSSKADSGHTHSPTAVYAPPRTASTAGAYSADGTLAGDIQLTCTAAATITPTGTPNGRMMIVECLSSGGSFTHQVAASVLLPTSGGPTSRSLTVPNGSVGIFGLRYSTLRPGWELLAAAVV